MPSAVDPNRIEVLDEAMADILRRMSPSERLAIAHGMWRSARDLVHNILRGQHPNWPDERIEREAARRLSHGAV